MKKFQEALLEQRKLNHLTQREVASRLGISQPSYIRYEKELPSPVLKILLNWQTYLTFQQIICLEEKTINFHKFTCFFSFV